MMSEANSSAFERQATVIAPKRSTTLDMFTKNRDKSESQSPAPDNSGVVRELRQNYTSVMNEMNRLEERVRPL